MNCLYDLKKWLLLNGPASSDELCKHNKLAMITPIMLIYTHYIQYDSTG